MVLDFVCKIGVAAFFNKHANMRKYFVKKMDKNVLSTFYH